MPMGCNQFIGVTAVKVVDSIRTEMFTSNTVSNVKNGKLDSKHHLKVTPI